MELQTIRLSNCGLTTTDYLTIGLRDYRTIENRQYQMLRPDLFCFSIIRFVNEGGEPVVEIKLDLGKEKRPVDGVIDTGFNGYYRWALKIGTERRVVFILSSNSSDTLIGTKLLKNRLLTINFANKTLKIEKVLKNTE